VVTQPAAQRRLTREWPCVRMLLMGAAGFTGFFATLSALPAWIAARGTSAASAGAATTVMLAATVLVQPLVPALLRRMSTTATMAIGLLALGLPAPALLWASTGLPLYGVCVLRGVGFAVFTVAGAVMTGEVAPPGRHGEVTGLYGLSAAVPNLVMVPLAVLLLREVGFWPIALLAAVPVLGAAPGWHGGPRRVTAGLATDGAADGPDTRAALASTLAPATVLCAVTIVGGAVVTILPIQRATGYVAAAGLLVYGLAGALARWQAGVWVDRVGVAWPLVATCLLTVAGVLVLAAGLSTGADPLTLVACAVVGGTYGAVQSLTLVSSFARAGTANRPVASALWNAAFDAGTGLGALLVGVLAATSLGLWGAFAVLALLVAATVPAGVASGRIA
jgi:MFS family permease